MKKAAKLPPSKQFPIPTRVLKKARDMAAIYGRDEKQLAAHFREVDLDEWILSKLGNPVFAAQYWRGRAVGLAELVKEVEAYRRGSGPRTAKAYQQSMRKMRFTAADILAAKLSPEELRRQAKWHGMHAMYGQTEKTTARKLPNLDRHAARSTSRWRNRMRVEDVSKRATPQRSSSAPAAPSRKPGADRPRTQAQRGPSRQSAQSAPRAAPRSPSSSRSSSRRRRASPRA